MPADCRDIRNRFEALDKEQRRARVEAITGYRDAQEALRNALDDVRTALRYDGDVDVTEGKDLKIYQKLERIVARAATTARNRLNTLLETLPEPTYFVHNHLNSTELTKLKDMIKDAEAVTKGNAAKQKRVWLEKLNTAKRRSQALTDPGWTGYWKLGEGLFGTADLWVKQNTKGKIMDRVVVKDTTMQPKFWKDPCLWINGLPDDQTSIPTEIQSLYNLRPRIGSSSVVRIRNWRIDRPDHIHRIFMEFCPRGDAESLILPENLYRKHARFDKANIAVNVKEQGVFIPEPLLWFFFETLTKAALLMERGELNAQGPAPWDLIVHRDMKLENIFFGSNTSGICRGNPEPKLGDFGIAIIAPSKAIPPKKDQDGNKVERQPQDIEEMGTVGNKPPEQYEKYMEKATSTKANQRFEPFSTLTNMWGVGINMYSLVACKHGLTAHFTALHAAKSWRLQESDWDVPEFDASARAHYSDELLDLIRECLEYDPNNRPSPDDVMRTIRQATAPGKNDKSKGMRLADASDIRFMTDHGVNFVVADRYTPGSDLWAWEPPAGSEAVDDPPAQQDSVFLGEKDSLGGNPGGPIGPVVSESALVEEDDVEGDEAEGGDDPEEPGGAHENAHDPNIGGGAENEENPPDEGPNQANEPPAKKSTRSSKRKAPEDARQNTSSKRQKKNPPTEVGREEEAPAVPPKNKPAPKATKKGKKKTVSTSKAGKKRPNSTNKAASPSQAKSNPQQKTYAQVEAPEDGKATRQTRAGKRKK